MYNTTNLFNEAILGDNRQFKARIKIGEKEITDGFTSIRHTKQSCSTTNITVGGAISSYVEMEMWKPDVQLEDSEIEVSIGMVLAEDNVEWVPLGLFTVQNPESDNGVLKFTAYDRIQSKMAGAYFSELSYPADGKAILNEIAKQTGVPIDTGNLVSEVKIAKRTVITENGIDESGNAITNTTYENPFTGYTYREALGYVAMLYCKFAVADRDGTIRFKWYEDADYDVNTDRYYDDLKTTELVFQVGKISCTGYNQSFSSGTGEENIKLENPVMTKERLDYIYSQIKELQFLPASVSFFGDMRLDTGDIVTVNAKDGSVVRIPVMNVVQEYDGGLLTAIQSYDGTSDSTQTKGPTLERLDRTYTELFLVKEVIGKKADFEYVHAVKGEFDALSAKQAQFESATANNFSAVNARIDTINASNITAENLKAEVAKLGYLSAESADLKYALISDLEATTAKITALTAIAITTTNLSAEVAKLGYAKIDRLESSEAKITALETGKLDAKDLSAEVAKLGYATITRLESAEAKIGTLETDKLNVKDLSAEVAKFGYLKTDELEAKVGTFGYLKTETAEITYLRMSELEAKVATFGYLKASQLEAEVGKFGYLKADILESEVAKFGYLKATDLSVEVGKFGYLTADAAKLQYAQIDFANVTGQVVGTSIIKDGAITDAKILSLSANKLTAGTIDAAEITVINLNADNITVGKINGKLIGTGTVDLDKLAEEVPTKEYLDSVQNGLQDQIDQSIQTYTVTTIPLLNNAPAQDWTAEDYPKHVGDICYVVNPGGQADGYTYRFEKSGDTYGWTLIKDSQVTEALQKLLTVDGDLSGLKSFQSETSSWISKTDSELSSVKTRTTTIETTYTTKTEAQNLASEALDNAKKYADDAVDGIEVGGRNLLSDSKFDKTSWKKNNNWIGIDNTNGTRYSFTTDGLRTVIDSGWGGTGFMIHVDKIPLKYGTSITVSMDLKIISNDDVSFAASANTAASGNWWTQSVNIYNVFGIDEAIQNKGTWVRAGFTMTIPSGESMYDADRVLMFRVRTINSEYFQRRVKIEKGNKATDWTPAPEDIEQAISTKVETTVFNEVKQTVDSNSAQITQMTKTLETKADGSTVETLQQTVNSVQQTANENTSKISQVTESAKNAQSAADSANSKIDGLQVGGRNLLIGASKYTKDTPAYSMDGNDGYVYYTDVYTSEKLISGETYTIQAVSTGTWGQHNIDGNNIDNAVTFWIYGKDTDTHVNFVGDGAKTGRYVWTWKCYATGTYHIRVNSYKNKLPFWGFKIEKGTIPTDWSPAPEDLATQESLTALSTTVNEIKQTADTNSATIKQLDGKIATKADNSTVTEVTERVAKAEQNLSGFQTEVKNTYTTKTYFENLQVGGRNLAQKKNIVNFGTSDFDIKNYIDSGKISFTVNGESQGFHYDLKEYYEPNSEYVLSYYVTKTSGTLTNFNNFHNGKNIIFGDYYIDDVKVSSSGYANGSIINDGKRHKIEVHYTTPETIPDDDGLSFTYIQPGRNNTAFPIGIEIDHFKLEKGNKATDWSPAPEDLATQESLETVSENVGTVEQTVSELSANFSSLEGTVASKADGSTVTELEKKYSSLETGLNGFKSEVGSTYVNKTTYNSDKSTLEGSIADIKATAEDAQSRVATAETAIEQNASEIELRASQSEVTALSDAVNVYIENSTKMLQDAQGWQYSWEQLIDISNAEPETHKDYITLQNGDIILGESESDLKVKIGNDAIQFKGTSDKEVTPDPDATAWITGQKFNINEGEIHNSLKVGRLQFVPRPNGNFAISIMQEEVE